QHASPEKHKVSYKELLDPGFSDLIQNACRGSIGLRQYSYQLQESDETPSIPLVYRFQLTGWAASSSSLSSYFPPQRVIVDMQGSILTIIERTIPIKNGFAAGTN